MCLGHCCSRDPLELIVSANAATSCDYLGGKALDCSSSSSSGTLSTATSTSQHNRTQQLRFDWVTDERIQQAKHYSCTTHPICWYTKYTSAADRAREPRNNRRCCTARHAPAVLLLYVGSLLRCCPMLPGYNSQYTIAAAAFFPSFCGCSLLLSLLERLTSPPRTSSNAPEVKVEEYQVHECSTAVKQQCSSRSCRTPTY